MWLQYNDIEDDQKEESLFEMNDMETRPVGETIDDQQNSLNKYPGSMIGHPIENDPYNQ
jgi:hypothetical protein